MPVTNVNLSGNPSAINPQFDLVSEQGKIARLRQIAQLLQAQSMKSDSPTVDAGMFKVPNWGSAIERMVAAYSGKDQMAQADKMESDLNGQVQQRTAQALAHADQIRKGTPDQYSYNGSQDVQEPEDFNQSMLPKRTPGTPGDPRAAAESLVASNLPMLAAMGQKDLDAHNKLMESIFPALERNAWHYSNEANKESMDKFLKGDVVGAAGALNTRPTAMSSGPNIATVQNGQVQGVAPGQSFTPPAADPVTGLTTSTEKTSGKTTTFSGGTQGVVNAVQQDALKTGIDKAKTDNPAAQKSANAIPILNRAMQVIQQMEPSDFTTVGAFKTHWNQVATALGLPAVPTTKIEESRALTQQALQEILRIYAPVSDSDSLQAEKSVGSASMNTKEGMLAVAGNALTRHQAEINQYNDQLKQTANHPFLKQNGTGDVFYNSFQAQVPDYDTAVKQLGIVRPSTAAKVSAVPTATKSDQSADAPPPLAAAPQAPIATRVRNPKTNQVLVNRGGQWFDEKTGQPYGK